jgi:hypothetical protein
MNVYCIYLIKNRLEWGSHPRPESIESTAAEGKDAQTLSADDLGMLLLHIHECRQIIWQNRRRFRGGLLRNLTEDLAELAGERLVANKYYFLSTIVLMTLTDQPFSLLVLGDRLALHSSSRLSIVCQGFTSL